MLAHHAVKPRALQRDCFFATLGWRYTYSKLATNKEEMGWDASHQVLAETKMPTGTFCMVPCLPLCRGVPRMLLGHQVTVEARRPVFPPGAHPAYQQLAEWCWKEDPAVR